MTRSTNQIEQSTSQSNSQPINNQQSIKQSITKSINRSNNQFLNASIQLPTNTPYNRGAGCYVYISYITASAFLFQTRQRAAPQKNASQANLEHLRDNHRKALKLLASCHGFQGAEEYSGPGEVAGPPYFNNMVSPMLLIHYYCSNESLE